MKASKRERFLSLLREEFAPKLRSLGFKGSGHNFVRYRCEVLNAVNIQGSKSGEACCINLGLHFSFLPPCWTEEFKPVDKLKEIDCEFRWRLSPRLQHDHWWSYGESHDEAIAHVRDLVGTYLSVGEPQFQKFDSASAVADSVPVAAFIEGGRSTVPWTKTDVRNALTMSRIHHHLKQLDLARTFATYGLARLGRATTLKPALESLANAT